MKKVQALFIVLLVIFLSGCVDVENIRIRYDIARDLGGSVTLDFQGIHSSADKPAEQKEEMAEFYESGYQEEASRLEREWSLVNVRTDFSRKSELRCDGKLVGDMEELFRSLGPLLQEQGTAYEIARDPGRFSFTSRGGWDGNDGNITLVIHYEGKIIENNAGRYDESAHEMEWNLGKLRESGIHFVLDLKE